MSDLMLVVQRERLRRENRRLKQRIKQLKQRIKRLEDAVDEAIAFCEFHGPVGATPDTALLLAKNLHKAKESKP